MAKAKTLKKATTKKATTTKSTAKKSTAKKSTNTTTKKKATAKKPTATTTTTAKAPPITLARRNLILSSTEFVPFRLLRRSAVGGVEDLMDAPKTTEVGPPDWFALEPTPPSARRYLYLYQQAKHSPDFVFATMIDGAGATRMPASGGWYRPIIKGLLYLVASDLLLTRAEMQLFIGGHEPPTSPAKPPFV